MSDDLTSGPVGARTLLLHGFTGSAAAWEGGVTSCLRSAGVDAVAIDLPGHGHRARRGEADDFSLDGVFRQIDSASSSGSVKADGADDAARAVGVVGYSMGGRLALHYAVRHPDRVSRLVLESSSPGLEDEYARSERRGLDQALAERIVAHGVARFVDEWEAMPLFASQRSMPGPVREAMRRRRLDNDGASLAAALKGLGTGALPSLWSELPTLAVKTLIVVGALDEKFVEIGERMVELLPHGRLVVVPGAGHAVHAEDPTAWCAAVGDFFAPTD